LLTIPLVIPQNLIGFPTLTYGELLFQGQIVEEARRETYEHDHVTWFRLHVFGTHKWSAPLNSMAYDTGPDESQCRWNQRKSNLRVSPSHQASGSHISWSLLALLDNCQRFFVKGEALFWRWSKAGLPACRAEHISADPIAAIVADAAVPASRSPGGPRY
jgi:hypothetical protein